MKVTTLSKKGGESMQQIASAVFSFLAISFTPKFSNVKQYLTMVCPQQTLPNGRLLAPIAVMERQQ